MRIITQNLSMIAAVNQDWVIGDGEKLLWRVRQDLQHFRENTLEHVVIMGHRTYKSIGKPLLKRKNIILSRNPSLEILGCEVFSSLDRAVAHAQTLVEAGLYKGTFIIGGAGVYQEALPFVNRILLTLLPIEVESEKLVRFPKLKREEWTVTNREGFGQGEFVELIRTLDL